MNTDMISSDWLSQPIFGALPLEIKKFATQPNFNFRCVQIGLDYWMDGLVEHITMGQKSKGLRLFTFFLLIISLMILNIPKDLSTYLPTSNSLEFAQLNGTAKAVSDALEADTTTSVTPKEAILDGNWNSQGGTIRRWGCDRRETPLIFVHIGKAGGGSVRARFAAAALDYKRWNWKQLNKDKHYYPVSDGVRDAKLCNSANQNFRIPNSTIQPTSFEGNGLCNATTPIGMAVACPQFYGQGKCGGCENLSSADCHTVYVGHNFLGTELHWLPPKYLENWWSNQWSSSANESRNLESEDGVIRKALASLMPRDHRWCPEHRKPRPKNRREAERIYSQCSVPLASRMDDTFRQFWRQRTNQTTKQINYAPLYSSLPLHRAVMLREPFSWLVSKFSWHHVETRRMKCDDMDKAISNDPSNFGWAYRFCLEYLLALCGDECVNRYEHGMLTLEELEAQAETNLRQSFSVVGLLHETDSFYDMVTARIHYVNMSLNPNVAGARHASSKTVNIIRCSGLFDKKDFQERFKEKLPILAALDRLYKVGVEVNRFQQEELKQCR